MKLSEIKKLLPTLESVNFQLPNGTYVPEHFHITEVGLITKNFIDCGGTVRNETVVNFQLWDANDFEHRLKPGKLLKIIERSEQVLVMEDVGIEVEYQTQTIGKYDLGFDGKNFLLLSKATDCLAKENCHVPPLHEQNACCTSDSNCC